MRIADDVWAVILGRGPLSTNVYLVRWAASWVLVDTGWPRNGPAIRQAVEETFGRPAGPRAILLTHLHPDHAGSLRELVGVWGAPAFVHRAELPLATGYVPEYANPLDERVIIPVLTRLPRAWQERMRSGSDLSEVVHPLDAGAPPGLPGWVSVHVPGHTPGSVAFFRPRDRMLISGDALLTVDLTSLGGLLAGRARLAPPLRFTDWDRTATEESIAALARLRPAAILPGHGRPLVGAEVASRLTAFAERLRRRALTPKRLAWSPAGASRVWEAPTLDR